MKLRGNGCCPPRNACNRTRTHRPEYVAICNRETAEARPFTDTCGRKGRALGCKEKNNNNDEHKKREMLKEKSTQLMIRHQDIDKLEQYYFKFPFNQQTQFLIS